MSQDYNNDNPSVINQSVPFAEDGLLLIRELHPGYKQATHWHSNASELVLWVEGAGEGVVTITQPGDHLHHPGETIGYTVSKENPRVLIPRGYPHSVAYKSGGNSIVHIYFDKNPPETFTYDIHFNEKVITPHL